MLSPRAQLVWSVTADSHFEAMTRYYEHQGWGVYTTDQEVDHQTYAEWGWETAAGEAPPEQSGQVRGKKRVVSARSAHAGIHLSRSTRAVLRLAGHIALSRAPQVEDGLSNDCGHADGHQHAWQVRPETRDVARGCALGEVFGVGLVQASEVVRAG